MDSSRDGSRRAPSFTLRCGREPPVSLERFGGQPIVLALCTGPLATSWRGDVALERGAVRDDDGLGAVRAELRGLGAVLLLVFDDGALCFGPEDEAWSIGPGDARDAADRAAMRARYGVSPGATGLFVIDGERRLRFSYIEVAPRNGTLHTIAGALSATGHIDMSRFTLSRRELVVSSLAAAFALTLIEAPVRAAAPAPAVEVAPGEVEVTLQINGTARRLRVDPRATLLDALRERLGMTGTKKGCDQGQCGACTVLVGGRRVNACLTLAVMAEGAPITTIEGLAGGPALHPLQTAFIACDGFQCGYCTSGQIMSAAGLLAEGHAQTDDEVREQMSGNICRCGAYPNIVAAIQKARKEL